MRKNVAPCNLLVTISTVGAGQCFLLMALVRSLGYKQILMPPLGFSLTTLLVTFELCLNPILITHILDALPQALTIWDNYVSYIGSSPGGLSSLLLPELLLACVVLLQT